MRAITDIVDTRALRREFVAHPLVQLADILLGEKPRATPDWLVKKNTKYPASFSRRIAFAAFGIQRMRSGVPI